MRPYVIVAPDFNHICGGIMVLHRLCHMLNERGIPAYITGRTAPYDYEGYGHVQHISALPPEARRDIQHNGIVIYPDIVAGNPLKFDTVVRWWLAVTQKSPEHEIVFSFTEHQQVYNTAPHNLGVFYTEDFFCPDDSIPKEMTCFRVHKGARLPRIPETQRPNCVEINGSIGRRQLAQLLKSSSIFYSYDDLTYVNVEARLCGCPVKIIDYTSLTPEKLRDNIFSCYAQASPGEEVNIEKLREEIPLFLENYRRVLDKSAKEFDQFIDITQSEIRPYVEDIQAQAPQTWLPIHLFENR